MTQKTKRKPSFLKRIIRFFLYLILIIILLLVGLYFSAGYLIKTGVNTFLPKVTGTPSSIETVELSPIKGIVVLKGLKIGNPSGFENPTIFELGHILVDVDPKSVLSQKIIVRKVLVEDTNATAEINKKGKINLAVLNDNVQNFIGTPSTERSDKTADVKNESQGSGKSVVVKDLKINDSGLNLGVAGQIINLKLPNIHKTNIGEGKKSNSISDTIALILSYFSEESLSALVNSTNELLKQSLSGVKELGDSGLKKLKQTEENLNIELEKAKKSASDLTDGLKGLFK